MLLLLHDSPITHGQDIRDGRERDQIPEIEIEIASSSPVLSAGGTYPNLAVPAVIPMR